MDFPPAFGGEALAFGAALFALICLASFSFYQLARCWRASRQPGWQVAGPLGLATLVIAGLMLTIFMQSVGDVAVLLLWGEIDESRAHVVMAANRLLDAASLLPFSVAGLLMVRGAPVIAFQLLRQPVPTDLLPTWAMVRKHALVVSIILFIAFGVAVGK